MPSLDPSTSPPCSWAIRRASVRPTPSPPRVRPRLWSCWANSSKACGMNSRSIPSPGSLTVNWTVFATRRTSIVITPGSSVNLAALATTLPSAWASRAPSPRTNRRASGRSISSRCPPAVTLSWLFATAPWTMLSTETCSRTSEIWPCAARVTSISSSTRRARRSTWRSRISRSRTRIGFECSSVRSTLAALAIGASGLRSSCESIARNVPWRRSARRSCWVRSARLSSRARRSWTSTQLPT